jgi:hypothetical protein
MPLSAAVQGSLGSDGLPHAASDWWQEADPEEHRALQPLMQRITIEAVRGSHAPRHQWTAGAYSWGLIQAVVSEDIISPDLVRQIYRFAQDQFNVPHPPYSDAELLPLFERSRDFIVSRIRQEGLPVSVYGHVIWTAVSLLAYYMPNALSALREAMPDLGPIQPHSALETRMILPLLRRALHDYVEQVDQARAATHQQQLRNQAATMEAMMPGVTAELELSGQQQLGHTHLGICALFRSCRRLPTGRLRRLLHGQQLN